MQLLEKQREQKSQAGPAPLSVEQAPLAPNKPDQALPNITVTLRNDRFVEPKAAGDTATEPTTNVGAESTPKPAAALESTPSASTEGAIPPADATSTAVSDGSRKPTETISVFAVQTVERKTAQVMGAATTFVAAAAAAGGSAAAQPQSVPTAAVSAPEQKPPKSKADTFDDYVTAFHKQR